MSVDVELDDQDLRGAMLDAANGGAPLTEAMAGRLHAWLADTWGERVNGDEHRYVTPDDIGMALGWDQERDPAEFLALADDALLAEVQDRFQAILDDDAELNLPAACLYGIEGPDGREAWLVNAWGGGAIASEPDQEMGVLHPTLHDAAEELYQLGFFAGSDVTLADVPAIREAIAVAIEDGG